MNGAQQAKREHVAETLFPGRPLRFGGGMIGKGGQGNELSSWRGPQRKRAAHVVAMRETGQGQRQAATAAGTEGMGCEAEREGFKQEHPLPPPANHMGDRA